MKWNKAYADVNKMKQAFRDGGVPFHDNRSWEVLVARHYDDGSGWYYFVGHYVAPGEFNKEPVWIGAAVGDYDEYGGRIRCVHKVCDTDMWTQYETPDKYL